MFVKYQDIVGLDQLQVLSDCYQQQERKQLWLIKTVTAVTSYILLVFALIALLPTFSSFFASLL